MSHFFKDMTDTQITEILKQLKRMTLPERGGLAIITNH